MDELMRKIGGPMAMLTILATIIAPLCGPLCALANRCGTGLGPEGSEGQCHHAAMANGFEASQPHFVAPSRCASRDLPPVTLNPNENWNELRQIQASAATTLGAVVGTMQLGPSLGPH